MKHALVFQWAYTEWATRRLLSACETLTPEQIDRDVGGSHVTIRRTLYHFYISEAFWVQCFRDGAIPRLEGLGAEGDPPPTSLDDMRREWPIVWSGLREYLDRATEAELASEIVGPDRRIDRWKLIMHLVNHATLHRGQVTTMIRLVGATPPNTDVLTYAMATYLPAQ